MESSSSKNSCNTDSVKEAAQSRGMKRSSSHLDLEELPDEQKETDVQERRLKKPMSQYEVMFVVYYRECFYDIEVPRLSKKTHYKRRLRDLIHTYQGRRKQLKTGGASTK